MHDKTVNNVALVVEYFLIFLERACCAQKSCQWSSNFRNMRKLPSGRFISTTSSHLTSAKEPQLRTGSGCKVTSLIGSKFTVFKNKIKKKQAELSAPVILREQNKTIKTLSVHFPNKAMHSPFLLHRTVCAWYFFFLPSGCRNSSQTQNSNSGESPLRKHNLTS